MKKIAIILVPLLLLAGGGGYWFLLKPSGGGPKPPPAKIDGTLFAMQPEFVVNLAGNHYAKISLALLLTDPPAVDPAAEIPKLPQDAALRAIVTDTLTGLPSGQLISRPDRTKLEAKILRQIKQTTDTDATRVLMTDVVVQ